MKNARRTAAPPVRLLLGAALLPIALGEAVVSAPTPLPAGPQTGESQPALGETALASSGVVSADAGTERVEELSILTALGVLTGGFWCVMLGVSCYLRCWRGNRKARPGKGQLTADEIERRFPSATTDDAPTCVVCLSTVEADERCRTTQCGHVFHADCIEAWWLHKPRKALHCPVCRKKQRSKVLPQLARPLEALAVEVARLEAGQLAFADEVLLPGTPAPTQHGSSGAGAGTADLEVASASPASCALGVAASGGSDHGELPRAAEGGCGGGWERDNCVGVGLQVVTTTA